MEESGRKGMLAKKINRILIILLIFFGFASVAYAVVDPVRAALPNVSDAGQFQKNVEETQVDTSKKAMPSISEKTPEAAALHEAEKLRLTLSKIIFSGNTVFSDQELLTIFAPSLHKNISLADLQKISPGSHSQIPCSGLYSFARDFTCARIKTTRCNSESRSG